VLREELSNVNRGIIKNRRSLRELLRDPEIFDGRQSVRVSLDCLERIASSCNLPQSQILLPITFFVPAGLYEGYVLSEIDARVIESLGVSVRERAGKYWVRKHDIRNLESRFTGCFQSVILP